MDYKEVLNKDNVRFQKLNEEINYLADRYGINTASKIIRERLNEDDTQQQQPQQQPQNNNVNQQQPQQSGDANQLLQEIGAIGKQYQELCKKYQNTQYINDLMGVLNSLKTVVNNIKGATQNAETPQQPQQQQQNDNNNQPQQQPQQQNVAQ